MPSEIEVKINDAFLVVPAGTSVAVALMLAGQACRTSVKGERRAPLCGMGTCFECRAVVNGKAHSRSCQIQCEQGMEVKTDE
jgi:D-hydroxyproline dehydrogenase subunit gamma